MRNERGNGRREGVNSTAPHPNPLPAHASRGEGVSVLTRRQDASAPSGGGALGWGNLLWRLILLLGLMGAFVASGAEDYSASQYYTIKVWGADEGLVEASVTDVAQTPEGYLWVGTLFGSVLRFDGTRFVSYNSANTPGFSLKWGVPRLMVDQTGILWISLVDGGMTAWDQQGFHPAFSNTNQPDRLLWSAPGKVTFAYGDGKLLTGKRSGEGWDWETATLTNALPQNQGCADAGGRVWYLRGENEIGIWDGKEIKTLAPAAGLEGRKIKVLTADAQGNIWAGTDQSLAEWQTDHFEVMTPTNGETFLEVKRIVSSGASSLWVEANGRMRRCTGRQWVAESDGWRNELGKLISLRFLHGDAEGGLWSAVGDLGLDHVLADGTFHRLTTRDGLPSNTVHFAYQDREGNTWTGYDRGGLVQVRRRLFRVVGKDEGLGDSLINTVCEDTQGALWIGTHSGTVGRYENGVCTNLDLPGVARTQDSCVTADAQGRVWIGAQRAGLLVSEGGQMQRVATIEQLHGYPRLLLPGRDGRLWVGTLWSIISLTNGEPTVEYTAETAGDHPTALAEAADGTIWAGTLAGLLLHWDGRQFIPLEPPDRNSLGRIWALWPSPDGSLWAGTEEGGLLHWNNNQFHRYTIKDGLPSDSIVQVQGDGQGNLWLGTRAGIVRILGSALNRYEHGEPGELPVSVYGKQDGLLTIGSSMIFQPNCWRGRDGTLYFAMVNSVAGVNPEVVHINPLSPTVILEEFQMDDKLVWPERVGAILTPASTTGHATGHASQPAPPPVIKVGPGRGDLEFRYTGLSLGSPSRVRFKYKLDGLETAWNDAGVERKASYRHVPPGQYVFHVIACNSDGVGSLDGGLLTVIVQPHFYQTLWFNGGVALLTLAGLALIVATTMRQRLRRRMEHLKRQHDLERERTRIAQDLHDDLGAGLTEIGLLGGLLQDTSRFTMRRQEALDRIVQRCHDLVMALDEIVWAVNPRNDSVNSLGSYLCRYAQSFLEATTIRCRLEMQEAEPDQPLNSEQRHNLFLAFAEALNNIVKHSRATEVRIKISFEEKSRLLICIEDDGRGLPTVVAEDADGLNNLRQRMAQIGAHCEISNRPAGGVAVTLGLRLAPGNES
jgi:signal transduction histidine kinase/ligand-binding sensor domain-containing protein